MASLADHKTGSHIYTHSKKYKTIIRKPAEREKGEKKLSSFKYFLSSQNNEILTLIRWLPSSSTSQHNPIINNCMKKNMLHNFQYFLDTLAQNNEHGSQLFLSWRLESNTSKSAFCRALRKEDTDTAGRSATLASFGTSFMISRACWTCW